ncbi:MAG: tetratricopeptide repeat protein, partial [Thermoanaerobaculia bacterium]
MNSTEHQLLQNGRLGVMQSTVLLQNVCRRSRGAGVGSLTLLLTLLLLVTLASTVGGADRNRMVLAQSKIAKGEKLLKKQDFETAEEYFRRAIEIESSIPGAYLDLGISLVGQNRFEEALTALDEAENKYVDWGDKLARADLEQRQRAFRESQEFETAVNAAKARRAPPSSGGGTLRGGEDSTVGTVDSQTVKNIQRQLEGQSRLARERWKMEEFHLISPQVFYFQGIARLRLNRREDGIRSLEKCLALDPKHGLAHYNLAVGMLLMEEPQ